MKNQLLLIVLIICAVSQEAFTQGVYLKQDGETAWTSFENLSGAKGAAGLENKGAKGHAFDRLLAGDSCVLLDVKGAGIVNRMWMTVSDRSPEMLRALKIRDRKSTRLNSSH